MTINPTAVPASNAAESTSTRRHYGEHETEETESRRPTIIFSPIGKVSSADNILEDEADNSPGYEVDRGCWRYRSGAGEDKPR